MAAMALRILHRHPCLCVGSATRYQRPQGSSRGTSDTEHCLALCRRMNLLRDRHKP